MKYVRLFLEGLGEGFRSAWHGAWFCAGFVLLLYVLSHIQDQPMDPTMSCWSAGSLTRCNLTITGPVKAEAR
jgi:hypothetical protein